MASKKRSSVTAKDTVPTKDVRVLKKPTYKSFRYSQRIKHPNPKISGSLKIFSRSIKHLWRNKRVFGGILVVYLLLTLVLVKGLGVGNDVAQIKQAFTEIGANNANSIGLGFTLFGVLLGKAGSASSDVGTTYQSIIFIVVSLAVIWALRQTHANKKPTAKAAFYTGLYPLIPFILVLLVVGIQLIPLGLSYFLYNFAYKIIATTMLEKVLWIMLAGMIGLVSFYMISSSVFALYIVTLPDMQPMRALRSARELVRYRRWTVLRKVFVMPLFLLGIAALIMVPLIIVLPIAAEWVFLVLTMAALLIMHGYMYELYRELL